MAVEQQASSNPNSNSPTASTNAELHVLAPAITSTVRAHSKRKEKAPIVESEVRRSDRLQQLSKGFKKLTCQDRNYFSCTSGPPTIATKIIKNLSVSFCKASAKDCT